MIKAVIFDVGGVITKNVEDRMYADLARESGLDFDFLWEIRDRYWNQYSMDKISEKQYWLGVLKESGLGSTEDVERFRQRLYSYIELIKGTFEIIKKLKLKGRYKLGILSDHSKEWAKYTLDTFRLRKFFDAIVFSYELKTKKPNEKMYRQIIKELSVKPEESVFIDDHEWSLKTAREIGIKTILFENPEQLERDLKSLGLEF